MTQQPPPGFQVKRVYDAPSSDDGHRVLVDRLWPRGIRKSEARIDEWAKDVTPSNDLRHWFHEDPRQRRDEFVRRYRAELAVPVAQAALRRLRALGDDGPVTLVTAVRDPAYSHVPVLFEQLHR